MGSHAALPITNTLTMILTKQTAATHLSDSHLWLPLSILHFGFAPVLVKDIAATKPRHSPSRSGSFPWMIGI